MRLVNLTFQDPINNIAFDEALLNELDQQPGEETFRLWESPDPLAVIGRSSRIYDEVNLEYCAQQCIPVFRRCTGGLSVVAGPGCLMYAVVLDLRKRPELRQLDEAHCFVLSKLRSALQAAGVDVSIKGSCDLTIGERKVSGNALRI